MSLSLALACALAFGSLAAQQGTPAPSPKNCQRRENIEEAERDQGHQGHQGGDQGGAKGETKAPRRPRSPRETTKESKETKGTKEKPEPAREESEQEIDIPVPDGVPVKGIKVPSYSPEGKLLMMLDAEQARKLDAERIEFENLKIDAYSDDDKKIYVELPRSIFNLTTRILTSESRVLIRREDFELVGDAGEFYTKNRFAKILGNVKMTILSTENFNTP